MFLRKNCALSSCAAYNNNFNNYIDLASDMNIGKNAEMPKMNIYDKQPAVHDKKKSRGLMHHKNCGKSPCKADIQKKKGWCSDSVVQSGMAYYFKITNLPPAEGNSK
jgi:hypothetical protein